MSLACRGRRARKEGLRRRGTGMEGRRKRRKAGRLDGRRKKGRKELFCMLGEEKMKWQEGYYNQTNRRRG